MHASCHLLPVLSETHYLAISTPANYSGTKACFSHQHRAARSPDTAELCAGFYERNHLVLLLVLGLHSDVHDRRFYATSSYAVLIMVVPFSPALIGIKKEFHEKYAQCPYRACVLPGWALDNACRWHETAFISTNVADLRHLYFARYWYALSTPGVSLASSSCTCHTGAQL